eukprot:373781-Amphidinium_carterae.2
MSEVCSFVKSTKRAAFTSINIGSKLHVPLDPSLDDGQASFDADDPPPIQLVSLASIAHNPHKNKKFGTTRRPCHTRSKRSVLEDFRNVEHRL